MGSITDDIVKRMLYRKLNSNKVKILQWEIKPIESFQSTNSGLIRFSVQYQFENEKFQEWFFAKIPSLSHMNGFNYAIGVLENELVMYEFILPLIHRVMKKNLAPKLFFSSKSNYSLILEDLISKGYQTFPRRYQFDLEPTLQILQEMARFHAASVHVHQIRRDVYDWLNIKYVTNHPLNKVEGSAERIGNLFMRLVHRVNPKFAEENAEKLEDFKKILMPSSFSQRICNENAFNVLNHGDFWTTNILLKYDDQEKIEDIKIIDFQHALWNTPSFDFLIFLMTSVKFDVFEKNEVKLYEIYVNTLNDTLKQLGINKLYTTEELIKDIQSKYSSWLYFIIIRLVVMFSNPDEFERDTLLEGKLLDKEWFKSVADKWISYFIRKSVESPENGILSK